MLTDQERLDLLIETEYFFARAAALRQWAGDAVTQEIQQAQWQRVQEDLSEGQAQPIAAAPAPALTGVQLARQVALAKAGR